MQELPEPSRVQSAGGKQAEQVRLRTVDDVPARYRNHPRFEELLRDPAHQGDIAPKVVREAMSAIEAELSGALKAPVTRSETAYIDIYDGEGYPFDIKTPLSPTAKDKWSFSPYANAETILRQLDKEHPNKLTGKQEPVAVLLDTTYMTPDDRVELWRELRRLTKENRSILKRVFEVNVQTDDTRQTQKTNPAVLCAALNQRSGR